MIWFFSPLKRTWFISVMAVGLSLMGRAGCFLVWSLQEVCADFHDFSWAKDSGVTQARLACSPFPLTFHPSLLPLFSVSPSLTPAALSFLLSSECFCNSYSYLLVGARIRASLLMCSFLLSTGKRRQRKHFKKLKLHAGKRKDRKEEAGGIIFWHELHAKPRTKNGGKLSLSLSFSSPERES